MACPKRRFGRTGIDMPVLTCGGMRLQMSWSAPPGFTMGDVDPECQKGVEDIIAKSFSCGINHFETARGYGSSELQYGIALKKHMDAGLFKREDIILQTKVSPDENAADFKKKMETSFAADLGLDLEGNGIGYVDLFAFHGINSQRKLDWVLKPGGCMEVIRQYQKEGKIKWVGFSTHGMEPLISKACATGEFDYVNLHYQFIGSFTASGSGSSGGNWPAVVEARKQDMGVFIISPTDKGGALYKPPAKFADACAPLSAIEFNNLYLLGKKNADSGDPMIHTLVVGAARPSDFDEHMKSIGGYEATMADPAQVLLIESTLTQMFIDAVGADWAANWWKGLPDSFGNIDGAGELVAVDQNPHAVNYTVMTWLWGICAAWDFHEFARMRFGMLVNNGKSYKAKIAEGKTNVEYVTTLMGDFGPGTDCMDLDDATLHAPIAGAACKDGVITALNFCKTKLHPDVCKGIALPKMYKDMRPDTCWPDRPKPKKKGFDWAPYLQGKCQLLVEAVCEKASTAALVSADVSLTFGEAETVTGPEAFAAFWAEWAGPGKNIDLVLDVGKVAGLRGEGALGGSGTFSHAHEDLRSQLKTGKLETKFKKIDGDYKLVLCKMTCDK